MIFIAFAAFSRKEVDNVVPSSNTWWRGRSYAASVASDIPDPEKDRKSVPVEARRAMVESFVDKYFLVLISFKFGAYFRSFSLGCGEWR